MKFQTKSRQIVGTVIRTKVSYAPPASFVTVSANNHSQRVQIREKSGKKRKGWQLLTTNT